MSMKNRINKSSFTRLGRVHHQDGVLVHGGKKLVNLSLTTSAPQVDAANKVGTETTHTDNMILLLDGLLSCLF